MHSPLQLVWLFLALTPTLTLEVLANQHGLAHFPVLAAHLFQNDRMPGGVALIGGHVILARPAPEAEFLDEVHFRENAVGDHDSTLSIRLPAPRGGPHMCPSALT